MKISEVKNKLGLMDATVEQADVNPLALVVHEEFEKQNGFGMGYRTKALQRLVKAKVSFQSEANTVSELARMLFVVKCPTCGVEMNYNGHSGNNHATSLEYECGKCKITVFMNMRPDAMVVNFPEK